MEISGKAGGAIVGVIVALLAVVGYIYFTRPPGASSPEQLATYDKMYKERMSGGRPSSLPAGGQGGIAPAPAPAQ